MRAFINGVEGNTVTLFDLADGVLNVLLLEDDGTPIDLTGNTLGLEIQPSKGRATLVKDLAGVITVATGGAFSVTVTPTEMDFGVGTYYIFAHRTDTGEKFYAESSSILNVK